MTDLLNRLGFTKKSLKRALRTFWQAFIGYIAVNYSVVCVDGDKATIKQAVIGVLIGAIAGGISAVMNREETPTEQEGD